jgi:hypothetical protein
MLEQFRAMSFGPQPSIHRRLEVRSPSVERVPEADAFGSWKPIAVGPPAAHFILRRKVTR